MAATTSSCTSLERRMDFTFCCNSSIYTCIKLDTPKTMFNTTCETRPISFVFRRNKAALRLSDFLLAIIGASSGSWWASPSSSGTNSGSSGGTPLSSFSENNHQSYTIPENQAHGNEQSQRVSKPLAYLDEQIYDSAGEPHFASADIDKEDNVCLARARGKSCD